MANHTDEELLGAVIHEAQLLAHGAETISSRDTRAIQELLAIAESLVSGSVTDQQRARVYEAVHPSTRSHYLGG
jgi:site-specific recombinase XerC